MIIIETVLDALAWAVIGLALLWVVGAALFLFDYFSGGE